MTFTACRAVPTNYLATMNIIIIVLPTAVAISVAVVTSHCIRPVIVAGVASVRTNLPSLIARVVLFVAIPFAITAGHLTFALVFSLAGSARQDQWCCCWSFLNNDLLGLGSLPDDDRSSRLFLRYVVLCFLADTLNLMAVRIIIAFFGAPLDPDLIISATPVPVTTSVAILISAPAVPTDPRVALVVSITLVGRWLKRRSGPVGNVASVSTANVEMISRSTWSLAREVRATRLVYLYALGVIVSVTAGDLVACDRTISLLIGFGLVAVVPIALSFALAIDFAHGEG